MPSSGKHDSYPILTFKNSSLFEKWLAENHSAADGIWLKIAKAKSGIPTVSHNEALDICLCYGWIDGLRRGVDNEYFVQKFTPRRTNSMWSNINKNKVAVLIKEGRMHAAGMAAIDLAKKNGRWANSYDSQASITIPAAFQKALDKSPKAKTFFAKLNSQNRYAILFRIGQVKKEVTKTKKIQQFISMLEKKETIYPQ